MSHVENKVEMLESVKYWDTVPATINGVLGGFSYAHNADIQESKALLSNFIENHSQGTAMRVVDCGSGIGRIGQFLLQNIFSTIDLVEPCAHLMEEAKQRIRSDKLGTCYIASLQSVELGSEMYDCITVQWVCMYLSDDEFIAFFKKCANALKCVDHPGFIFLKENLSNCRESMEDTLDSSETRTEEHMDTLLCKAGLRIRRKQRQQKWFDSLLPVCMYILTV